MPLASSFVSSLLLAQAMPGLTDVTAALTEGRLVVQAVTAEPVPRHEVHGKLTPEALVVYIQGVTVGRNRVFLQPDGRVVGAHPRTEYTKLVVPFGADAVCGKPIDIEVTENRIAASVRCSPRRTGWAAPPAVDQAASPSRQVPAPSPAADLEAARPEPSTGRAPFPPLPARAVAPAEPAGIPPAAALAAAPPPPPAPPPAAPTAAVAGTTAPAPVAAPPPPAPAPVAAPTPTPTPVPTPTAAPLPARSSTPGPAQGPLRAGGLGGLWPLVAALAMAGVCAVLLWRRRQRHGNGVIRILESASLGPKRALVLADVGGQRLILGTSEAGIALLSQLGVRGVAGAADGAPILDDTTLVTETTPIPAPEGEKGFLARLFTRKREEEYLPDDDGPSTMAEDFRDLLEESLDDEELRRRLQAGIGGKTK